MMPAIPLPFVIALLLAILLFRLVKQNEPTLRPAILFTTACVVLVTAVGVRWTFDARFFRFVLPIVASLLPPIAWFCFSGLKRASLIRHWPHLVPTVLIAILSASWRIWQPPLDLFLACLYFGYGIALIRLVARGPDALQTVRFSDAPQAYRATLLAGCALIVSAVVDLLIAGDFDFYQGVHAASIVAVTQLILMPVIVYGVVVIGSSMSQDEEETGLEFAETEDQELSPHNTSESPVPVDSDNSLPEEEPQATDDDHRIVDAIDQLMRQQQLYRDADLNLNRLARRACIPSRQISAAINRVLGRNVSQVVNEYRVEEAKRLLHDTDHPVTTVMFEAGFQTKSNFNREFQRVVGMAPTAYRNSAYCNTALQEEQ